MKRALGWVVNIILIWLLVIVVAFFLLPRIGGWRFDAVLSGSMEPALHLGGVVFIKPVEPTRISTGDIITYRSGELLVTHRVVEVIRGQGEPSFVTKGDASDPDMAPVPATNVVGEVVFSVPYLGYLAAFIKTKLGFLLTLLIPGLAIIGLELRNMWQVVLRKETTKAGPEVTPPLNVDTPVPLEHHSQTEPQVTRLKMEKRLADVDSHSKVGTFLRSPLFDKIAIGVAIGAAAAIIAILGTLFLMEVL